MARSKMLATDYYRQIKYPRARFVAPKENDIRDKKKGRVKIKKVLPQFKNIKVKKMDASLEKWLSEVNLFFQHLKEDVNTNLHVT